MFVWLSCVVFFFDWVDLWIGVGEGGGVFGRFRFVFCLRVGVFEIFIL